MIFFADNKKVFGLFALALMVTVFIFAQNFRIKPVDKIVGNTSQDFWDEMNKQTSQTMESVKDSWELGVIESQGLGEEIVNDIERQKLLEEAQIYVKDKQASTTPTSTSPTSTKD